MATTINAVSVDISSSPSKSPAPKKTQKVKKVVPAKPRKTKLPAKDGVAAKSSGKPGKNKSAAVDSKATAWIVADLPKAKGKRTLDDMVKAFSAAKGSSKGAVNLVFIDGKSSNVKGKPKVAKSGAKKQKKAPDSKASVSL
jgi:hypothetical protein